MAEVNSAVKTVIQVLHDGHEGFAQIGEHIKNPSAKTFFVEESATRHKFEHELKAAAGALHRTWGDMKAHLGGGDHTLLETAEQGEDAAKKAYEEALKEPNLSASVREVLTTQQRHILESHNKVKALRDSTK